MAQDKSAAILLLFYVQEAIDYALQICLSTLRLQYKFKVVRDTNECISYLFTQISLKVIILVSVSFSQQNSLQCQGGEQGYWLRFNFFMHDLIRDQITLVSTLHLNFLEIFRPVNHPLPI